MITQDEARQLEATIKAEGYGAISSSLGCTVAVRRETIAPGETRAQAKARWRREREIEADHYADPRLVHGRVMPIHYE